MPDTSFNHRPTVALIVLLAALAKGAAWLATSPTPDGFMPAGHERCIPRR